MQKSQEAFKMIGLVVLSFVIVVFAYRVAGECIGFIRPTEDIIAERANKGTK